MTLTNLVRICETFDEIAQLLSIRWPLPKVLVDLTVSYISRKSVIYIGDINNKLSGVHADQIVHLPNLQGKFIPTTLSRLLTSCQLYFVSFNCFFSSKDSKMHLQEATKEIEENSQLFHTVIVNWCSVTLGPATSFTYMVTWLRETIQSCGLSFNNFIIIHNDRITNFSSVRLLLRMLLISTRYV